MHHASPKALHAQPGRSLAIIAFPAIIAISVTVFTPVARATHVIERWEPIVKQANLELDHGRYHPALHLYKTALGILEKQGAYDIRSAVVMKDMARVYRILMNRSLAKLWESKAALVYKEEIDKNQLGSEYSRQETELVGQRLRPACPVCHDNFKVVPIHLGEGTGYDGPVPAETDPRFVQKPAAKDTTEERWYCKGCKQDF